MSNETLDSILSTLHNIESLLRDNQSIMLRIWEQKNAQTVKRRKQRENLYTPEFESAWKVYPLGAGKKEAGVAYPKAIERIQLEKPHLLNADDYLLSVLKEFASCWPTHRDKKFCPHLSTFLNKERYNDDPATWKDDNTEELGGPVWKG